MREIELKLADVRELFRQLVTFGVVGVAATVVHYFVALAASMFIPIVFANPVGFLCAFWVSYFGHLHLTFQVSGMSKNHLARIAKFFAVALAGFLVGQGALVVLLSKIPMLADWQALMLAVAIVPITTFVISRIWVFKDSSS